MASESRRFFVSYTKRDEAWASWIAWQLETLGHSVTIQAWDFPAGSNFVVAMNRALAICDTLVAVLSKDYLESGFATAEWASAFASDPMGLEGKLLPIVVAPLSNGRFHGLLAQTVHVDLRGIDELEAVSRLGEAAVPGRKKPAVPPLFPGKPEPPGPPFPGHGTLSVDQRDPAPVPEAALESPYRGLTPFGEQHHKNFVGREVEAAQLQALLAREPVVFVVGPSGVGKSSLVNAGLVPLLRERNEWLVIPFRPAFSPYDSLAAALIKSERGRPTIGSARRLVASIREDGLQAVLRTAAAVHESSVLLVVDQLEELFTANPSASERSAFLETVLSLEDSTPRLGIRVVATLRADFMGVCLESPVAATRLQGRTFLLSPLSSDQLRRVIVEPAADARVSFSPGLVERLVTDVGEGAGVLPLLEFSLDELWKLRAQGVITHESYESIGTVRGAIEQHAERALGSVEVQGYQEAAVRRLFLALIRTSGPSDVATRRATRVSDLGDEAGDIVNALIGARLLVTGTDDSGYETVELAHEAIIGAWQRLSGWLKDDLEYLRWRSQIEELLQTGIQTISGRLLSQGSRWIGERGDEIPEPILDLVARSHLIKDVWVREHHWMVGNSLQVVASLLRLHARRTGAGDPADALKAATRRVSTVGIIHLAMATELRSVVLGPYSTVAVPFDEIFASLAHILVRRSEEAGAAESGRITISTEGIAGLWPSKAALTLAIVLTELINNSIEHGYTGGDGEIRVSFHDVGDEEDDGRRVEISVTDFGKGLDPADAGRSAGFGLELARAIVSDHDGTIEVEAGRPCGVVATCVMWVARVAPQE